MRPPPTPAPRALPLTCLGFAHLALLAAMVLAAVRADAIAASPLHPLTLVAVHLVTVGFLVPMIAGATWIVMPLAFRLRLPAGWLDWLAVVAILLGGLGVASHFVFGGYLGVALSGGMIVLGALVPAARVASGLGPARAPALLRVPITLAWLHLLLAGTFGVLVALDRDRPFLPAGHLRAIAGHAHLAAIGFALLLFVGIGYRLLPMVLPARPPRGALPWIPIFALGGGAPLLALGLLFGMPVAAASGAVASGAGIAAFVATVLAMQRRAPPPPRGRPTRDVLAAQVRFALLWLLVAAAIGLWLAFAPAAPPNVVAAYGCAGLLGFFALAVLAIAARLVGWFAWRQAWLRSGCRRVPALPADALGSQPLQWTTATLGAAGTTLLFTALLGASTPGVRAGAWLLAGAAAAAFANLVVILHRAGATAERALAIEAERQ